MVARVIVIDPCATSMILRPRRAAPSIPCRRRTRSLRYAPLHGSGSIAPSPRET